MSGLIFKPNGQRYGQAPSVHRSKNVPVNIKVAHDDKTVYLYLNDKEFFSLPASQASRLAGAMQDHAKRSMGEAIRKGREIVG